MWHLHRRRQTDWRTLPGHPILLHSFNCKASILFLQDGEGLLWFRAVTLLNSTDNQTRMRIYWQQNLCFTQSHAHPHLTMSHVREPTQTVEECAASPIWPTGLPFTQSALVRPGFEVPVCLCFEFPLGRYRILTLSSPIYHSIYCLFMWLFFRI